LRFTTTLILFDSFEFSISILTQATDCLITKD
jgi:hypothetical protein